MAVTAALANHNDAAPLMGNDKSPRPFDVYVSTRFEIAARREATAFASATPAAYGVQANPAKGVEA